MRFNLRVMTGNQELGPVVVHRGTLPRRLKLLIGLTSLLTFVFLVAIPAWTLLRGLDAETSSSIIQASTSWFGSALAVAAGIVAVLAYRNSVQRPDLDIHARNSLNNLLLRLTNEGVASATQPVVTIRFNGWSLEPAQAPGWRPADFAGDGRYSTFTWTDDAVTLHPSFSRDLPEVRFPMQDPFNPAASEYIVRAQVAWSSGGAVLKTQELRLRFPSAR